MKRGNKVEELGNWDVEATWSAMKEAEDKFVYDSRWIVFLFLPNKNTFVDTYKYDYLTEIERFQNNQHLKPFIYFHYEVSTLGAATVASRLRATP